MHAAAAANEHLLAGWLNEQESRTLDAICATFFPVLTPPEGCSPEVAAYYERDASSLHLPLLIAETLGREDEAQKADFHTLLALLAQPAVALLLVGQARSFAELALPVRERYLLRMANSPVARLRQGFQAFKRLCGFLYFSVPDPSGVNPSWKVLNYSLPTQPAASLAPHALVPEKITSDTTLECDVVVVGSGAGGGVIAGELACAGKQVIVLEQGSYINEQAMSVREAEGMSELYLKHGLLSSSDLGVVILAGRGLGGGTVVNWTTALRTPPDVLQEWQQRSGLSLFTEPALNASFSSVEQRLGVNLQNSAHNRQNQVLYEGARALGYHSEALPRNAQGCEQRCGSCGFGCRYGCKRSTTRTYLQDAYEHGARLLTHCTVHKVVLKHGRAVGVEAVVNDPEQGGSRRVTVHARAVVIAGGALHTPAVLLRSGLTHEHIGRHLHLHPTTTISGVYPEKIQAWEGVMQSAYSREFAHLSDNYGYTLEVPPAHPGLFGLSTPWTGAQAYRDDMLRVAYNATIIVLTRDKGEGRVRLGSDGEPVIDYVTSTFDRRHLLHGLRTAARIHVAQGALAVTSIQSRPARLELTGGEPATKRQQAKFAAQLERHGLGPNRLILFSAHQMGTCRMGVDPARSVTDEHGEVHGVKGLFVCDGSLFPAASGVNPMLSIMALAHYHSQYLKNIL